MSAADRQILKVSEPESLHAWANAAALTKEMDGGVGESEDGGNSEDGGTGDSEKLADGMVSSGGCAVARRPEGDVETEGFCGIARN